MVDRNFLEHIGILGMKWGHRKAKTTSDVQVVRTQNSEDHDKKVLLRSKHLNEMTNDELRSYVQRVSLEKQYKELTKKQLSPGKKYVKDLLINTGKSTLESYLKKYAAKQVEEFMKKKV